MVVFEAEDDVTGLDEAFVPRHYILQIPIELVWGARVELMELLKS